MNSRWIVGLMLCLPACVLAKPALSEAQIKQEIIRESIEAYPGRCPCPYHTDRAGRRCGQRSAYSRPGGEAPVCYVQDVTPDMVAAWKARHAS